MRFPPDSPTLEAGVDNWHQHYASLEKILLENVDELARAGFSDKRWCAIARTHFEEGFLALHRALRDYPGDSPNEYGKVATHQPMPPTFAPRPEPSPRSHLEPPDLKIEDYRADGDTST